ncbi:amino acid permease [Lactiplantibacillus paraplantarum]|uniref:Amino acid permease n=1 Tax=Lactiplantibacillus paraplantarum TaxID=60520 RepID=A0A4Q9XZY2_9LACO|nr:amino acid permease [Lactiplantibacillus paraplantarum]
MTNNVLITGPFYIALTIGWVAVRRQYTFILTFEIAPAD